MLRRVAESLSGVRFAAPVGHSTRVASSQTVRFKSELVRNITIKLGYANAKIYRSDKPCVHLRSAGYPVSRDAALSPAVHSYMRPRVAARRTNIRSKATPRGASCSSCATCPLLTAPATTFSWRRCSTVGLRVLSEGPLTALHCPSTCSLAGAAVMDAALLLIAGNEPCPQPQTSEHLAAVEIMQLKNIIILQVRLSLCPSLSLRRQRHPPPPLPPLQNKIDLVKEEHAREHHEQIKAFVAGTVADAAPIIPISAQVRREERAGACSARSRLLLLLPRSSSTTSTLSAATSSHTCVRLASLRCYPLQEEAPPPPPSSFLSRQVPIPVRDFTSSPRLIVIRSFDVNKPGEEVHSLKGGVAGGSILQARRRRRGRGGSVCGTE